MNPSDRASHPSRMQVERLLYVLERNLDLAKGFSKVPSARDAARKRWEKLAHELNSMGGCVKSWKQWTKYWADKKSAVKKKGALRFRARNRTGGGAEVVELNNIEEKILAIMGGESFAVDDRHLQINPFHEPVVPTNQDSPSVLATQDVSIDASHLTAQNPSTPSASMIFDLMQSMDIPVTEESPCLPQTPPRTNEVASPILPSTPSGSGRHPQRRPLTTRIQDQSPTQNDPSSNTAGTSRIRHRCRRTLSPPSQRQSQFVAITERFLSLEEQRIEIDRQNSQFMGKLADAMMGIGEGLKLLAENLKK